MFSKPPARSPDGRYAVHVDVWEAFNSHWVESPKIVDAASGALVFVFRDGKWSLDECRWLDATVVEWTLRKYPGSHKPSQILARIDCANCTAGIDAGPPEPLDALEAALEARLAWR